MKLKDIKVGMKVKIPQVMSRSVPTYLTCILINKYNVTTEHEILKKVMEKHGYHQDYLYVVEIDDNRIDCVFLGFKPNEPGMGTYYPKDIEPYEEAKVEKQPDLKFEPCVCSTRISVKIEDLKAINKAVHELNKTKSGRVIPPADTTCILTEELKKLKEILVKYGI